ncbi:zinc ribbon domain-containing protein, partial [Enterococcus lemanii]
RQCLEYKAKLNGQKVIAVDPRYTSQTCPKCGHIEKANRNKKQHLFKCKNCQYESNDDRIAAMNLHRKGIEHIGVVTTRV